MISFEDIGNIIIFALTILIVVSMLIGCFLGLYCAIEDEICPQPRRK